MTGGGSQRRPRRGLYVLPSLFTAGNIAAGFYAITQSLQATPGDYSYFNRAALAIAFALAHAGFPTERAFQGRSPARVALLPYQLAATALMGLTRRLGREAPFNPLAPGLFLGRLPHCSERPALRAAGIDAVLNLCAEFPGLPAEPGPSQLITGRVPILDDRTEIAGLSLAAESGAGRRNRIGSVRVRRLDIPDPDGSADEDAAAPEPEPATSDSARG